MPGQTLIQLARELSQELEALKFAAPVSHVYNPLRYARASFELYLERFAQGPKRVIFLGMNPGPFGMAQTGVPFGEIRAVRDWLGIHAPVEKPAREHARRPVDGFACRRSEVSGKRLWGLFAERFKSPERFFQDHFVLNYCPLLFLEASGKNRTPEQLPAEERTRLAHFCDEFLRQAMVCLEPRWIIGVGAFAAGCARRGAEGRNVQVGQVLHPSPASPAANRDWSGSVTRQLVQMGVW